MPSGSLFARSAARWRKHICVFFAIAADAAACPEGGRKDLEDLEVGEFAKWKESSEKNIMKTKPQSQIQERHLRNLLYIFNFRLTLKE